jgi:hypothetical protein
MYHLANFTLRDMTELGVVLRRLGEGAQSMEEVANRVVRTLYERLVDPDTGERSCALVRFFKTHAYAELDAPLRDFARGMLHDRTAAPGMKCLSLLATAGYRSEWNSRRASVAHRAIPLASEEIVSKAPMISSLLQQLGVELGVLLTYIPDQDDFVKPIGVESVLGFGGMLPMGDIFVVIVFSRAHIPRETAELFRTLALNVKMATLPFGDAVFDEAPEQPA